MNDRYLFRGKRTDNGEWVYGNYCYAELIDKSGYEDLIIEQPADGETRRVIPETVGQYTGLTDKNGKKIFEYDIVKEGCNGLIGVVVWDNDLATYKLEGFGEGYTIQDAEIEWELIGNKFDNPELLKGE